MMKIPSILLIIVLILLACISVNAQSCAAKIIGHEYVCTVIDISDGKTSTATTQNDGGEGLVEIDYGMQQVVTGNPQEIATIKKVIKKMEDYMKSVVVPNKRYPGLLNRCKNFNQLCAFWTSLGECDTNRRFMFTQCAASCRLCLLAELSTSWS